MSVIPQDQKEFERLLSEKLGKYDIELPANHGIDVKNLHEPNFFEWVLTDDEGEKYSKKIADHYNLPNNQYRIQLREFLERAGVSNIPQPPDSPDDLFIEAVRKKLSKYDIELPANHGIDVRNLHRPDNFKWALKDSESEERKYSKKIADHYNLPNNQYRVQLREILERAGVSNIPQAPDSPDALFIETVRKKLAQYDIALPINHGIDVKNLHQPDNFKWALKDSESEERKYSKKIADHYGLHKLSDARDAESILNSLNIAIPAQSTSEETFIKKLVGALKTLEIQVDEPALKDFTFSPPEKELITAKELLEQLKLGNHEEALRPARRIAKIHKLKDHSHRVELRAALKAHNLFHNEQVDVPPPPANPEEVFKKALLYVYKKLKYDLNEDDIQGLTFKNKKQLKKAIALIKDQAIYEAEDLLESIRTLEINSDEISVAELQRPFVGDKSHLDAFVERGMLDQVFTAEVWKGKETEMEKAWKLVPEDNKSDLDIESVRVEITKQRIHEKFPNIKPSQGWVNGF